MHLQWGVSVCRLEVSDFHLLFCREIFFFFFFFSCCRRAQMSSCEQHVGDLAPINELQHFTWFRNPLKFFGFRDLAIWLLHAPHVNLIYVTYTMPEALHRFSPEFPHTASLCLRAQRTETSCSQHRQLCDCQSCRTPHYTVSSPRRIHCNRTMPYWWSGKPIIYLKGRWQAEEVWEVGTGPY